MTPATSASPLSVRGIGSGSFLERSHFSWRGDDNRDIGSIGDKDGILLVEESNRIRFQIIRGKEFGNFFERVSTKGDKFLFVQFVQRFDNNV